MKQTIESVVRAGLERAWQTWADPREGGRFRAHLEAEDGGAGFEIAGTFTRVVPCKLLEYRMDDSREVHVVFVELDDGVRVSTSFETESATSPLVQRECWQAVSDRLARRAEGQAQDAAPAQSRTESCDGRPLVGVAHVVLETDRMEESTRFFRAVGMRPVSEGAEVSVLELRGGTHLILLRRDRAEPGDSAFDLMVDDLHATHRRLAELGLAPSAIEAMPRIDHESFTVREPAGHVITIYSSHVTGDPV